MNAENSDEIDAFREWAKAMSEYLTTHPDHDLTAEDIVGNARARLHVLRAPQRTFTAEEVVEIANETSDSLGNLYRLDFIDRIRHEAEPSIPPATPEGGWCLCGVVDDRGNGTCGNCNRRILTDGDEHDCATCEDCLHDGRKCCGCYDGSCCQAPSTSPATTDGGA